MNASQLSTHFDRLAEATNAVARLRRAGVFITYTAIKFIVYI